MDFESLLMGVINNRLTKLVSNAAANVDREDRGVPDSTRRAFNSRMTSDARVARMAAQNMEDAKAMVNVAQTNVTAIKSQFQKIQELLIEYGESDTLAQSDELTSGINNSLQDHIAEIVRLAKNTTFNGMNLFDGTNLTISDSSNNKNGFTNDYQIQVVLQAGESQRNQKFINFFDNHTIATVTGSSGSLDISNVLSSTNGNMNLDNLSAVLQINGTTAADRKQKAQTFLGDVQRYIERMQSLESQYSYDYKSLDNLSILFEEQADIFDKTRERSEKKQTSSSSLSQAALLSELLASSSNSNAVLSGLL